MHPQSHRSCPCVLLAVLLGLVVDVTRGSWSIQPIPQYPAIRGSVTLSPTGINEKVTSVVWFKGTDTNPPSQILTYIAAGSYTISGALHSPRFSAFSNGSLHITDLLLTDQGEYTVKVQAEKTSMDLRVTLTVHEPVTKPKITASTPQPKENEPLTLTCVTSHAVTITWTRRGTSISSGAKLSGDNKTLTFSSITRGDSGEYQCGAQNLVSKDVSDPHAVSVLYGPSEARIEGEVFVRPGSSITLTCSADSYPPPEFQWKVNDTDTGAKTSKYGVSNAETQDQGLYTCVVRNPATLRMATTAVYVNVTAEFVPPGADLPMIIGVAVATVLLLILIAAVTYLFIIHKRRKSSSDTSSMMKGSSRNGQADNATQAMEEHELQYAAIQFSNSTPRKTQKPETIYENRRPQPPAPPSDNVVYSDLKLR
ncbi:carcinoembryonic antigen-related cell adhesion molecule 2-like [Bufo bufo]|uniref:carcinoembryonic antigen-related cell adhesion molecule 2-like n=1 Tax=Bufo bufo TaxID=8384 RepID=UPI001ABDEDCF|nr:carcinoembryonic antigen-related cell adhesion molecule 2-like [Bufo bufo]